MNDLTETLRANPNVSPELVDRLFQKLHTMYGKHWAELWAGMPLDAVKTEWARALTGVSPDTMRLALDSMMAAGKTFPPTLPEFVSLCRQFIRKGSHRLMLADNRKWAPDGGIQSLRDIIKRAGR